MIKPTRNNCYYVSVPVHVYARVLRTLNDPALIAVLEGCCAPIIGRLGYTSDTVEGIFIQSGEEYTEDQISDLMGRFIEPNDPRMVEVDSAVTKFIEEVLCDE